MVDARAEGHLRRLERVVLREVDLRDHERGGGFGGKKISCQLARIFTMAAGGVLVVVKSDSLKTRGEIREADGRRGRRCRRRTGSASMKAISRH